MGAFPGWWFSSVRRGLSFSRSSNTLYPEMFNFSNAI